MTTRSPLVAAALLALAPSASAQSFNVIVHGSAPLVIPAPTFAGVADSPGPWNRAVPAFGSARTFPLADVAGTPTSATITIPSGTLTSPLANYSCVEPDLGLILGFFMVPACTGLVRFAGLEDGLYSVVTYAYQADFFWVVNEVEVIGSVEGPQSVGGARICPTGVAENAQYTRHTVQVSGGQVLVDICAGGAGFKALNGFQLVRLDVGSAYCAASANSTGGAATLLATGSDVAAAGDLTLIASGMPAGEFGLFLTSRTQDFVPGLGGTSDGNLCLGGSIGRFVGPGQILSTGTGGTFRLDVDLNALPQGSGAVSGQAGETWSFQAWFRDPVGLGSNLTRGLEIELR
ncbi:MAG: hypothetical protein AAFP86_01290 [Planctomycetota bacterium]